MLLLQTIRENADAVIAALLKKHYKSAAEDIGKVLETDEIRRKTQAELDTLLASANKAAKEIGSLMQQGKAAEAEAQKKETAELKVKTNELGVLLKEKEKELTDLLLKIPNTPHANVPEGRTAEDNPVVFEHGIKPVFSGEVLPHWDLIKKYDIIDFDLGIKITGAGFPVYKGKGARLNRALINFFLNEAEAAGYTEVQPPILVNADSGYGTGQLPDKDGQMYYAGDDELYLIPTAEVPITNIYRDVLLNEEDLPIKNAGYTPCFRREAGSWGAHVRGLNRLHQFDKVEIVQIAQPEESYRVLEEMKEHIAGLLKKLGLQFRIITLCGGDISFTSAFTYDFEVWSAAQERWLEVSSVSNFETYQANRLKLRYKSKDGKKEVLHTLNGSALALPRIVAAILENNQTPQGITMPPVLVPYLGFEAIN